MVTNMRSVVSFYFFFASLLILGMSGCEGSKSSVGLDGDQFKKPVAGSVGVGESAISKVSAGQQSIARENDQLLDNALGDPDQKRRADLALQVHLRPSYEKCVKRAEGATPTLLECNAEEFRYQDSRLNRLYRERMNALDKSHQNALRDRQREWIRSRDMLCNINGVLGGGQAEALEQSSCQLNATAKRADELERAD